MTTSRKEGRPIVHPATAVRPTSRRDWSNATCDRVVAHLEDVAEELSRRGVAVRSLQVHAGRPMTGRLMIACPHESDRDEPRLAVVWRDGDGWSTAWMGEPGTWPHHSGRVSDDPAIAAVTVACLVADLMVAH